MNTNIINELESEASKRCEAQAKTIANLIEENKRQAECIVVLQNRCYGSSHGLCVFCSMRKTCKKGELNIRLVRS